MKSHDYGFGTRDLMQLLGLPLVPVVLFALVVQVAAVGGILPLPRPALDTDRTILVHQAEASRRRHDADMVLIGDSSCLMNVSAKQLGRLLGRPVLNLGTLSYLDLDSYALLLREFSAANPGRPATVVLLLHPEALRRAVPEKYHVDVLQSYLRGRDQCWGQDHHGGFLCWLGLEVFRGRIWSRLVPSPLAGVFGRRYGFSADLESFMFEHDGSALDPDASVAKGDADYRLARQLESASGAFKSSLPSHTRLLVGLTPAPENFVRVKHQVQTGKMLAEWGVWLRADATLSELPATLPDAYFAKTTHLNEAGVRIYTEGLAKILQRQAP